MKVYFDNAATTPLHPEVFEKMKPFFTENYGNASSIHSFGRTARVAIENARETAAEFLNADPSEIYFTSGGSEANNFIIRGIAETEAEETKRNHIITTKADHHSVIDTFEELKRKKFSAEFAEVNPNSVINTEVFSKKIGSQTSLISVIYVNNETGAVNPLEELSEQISDRNIFFHSDCVQGFGKLPIDVKKFKLHALTASAHKINGPKGIGLAYIKSGTPMKPLIFGGSQERNRRAGTENVAYIAGFAEAIKIAKHTMTDKYRHAKQLKERFIAGLNSIDKEGIIINSSDNSSPYILSVTLKADHYNNDSEAILMFLDINGVAVSNGAACTSGTWKPSHVILASGYSIENARGTIRFSFGYQNTFEEVDYALDVFEKLTRKFSK
jgi:cysteine desulfurase